MLRIDRNSKNPKLVSVFTGDVCNLACVLCGPEASTRWQYELGNPEKTWAIEPTVDFDFTGVESVIIGGGEPVLNKTTLPLLKSLSSDIHVAIHFNGTVLPTKEFLDESSRFNNMKFILSIDDVEEQFEFLRYPAKWSQVTKNILWLRDNCPANVTIAFNTVVSILNQETHTRLFDWVKQHMPMNTECHTNESNGLLNRYNYQSGDVEFLDRVDQQRNTNWRMLFPKAAVLLDFKPA